MSKSTKLFFLSFHLFAFASFAADSSPAFIKSIRVDRPNNRALVYLKTPVSGTDTWAIQFSQSAGNQMLSLALTALSTGLSVSINPVGGCEPGCSWGSDIKELVVGN